MVKRKRNNNGLTRRSRIQGVANSKRRKVHAPYRLLCNNTQTINRIREIVGADVHSLTVNGNSINGFTNGPTNKTLYLIGIRNYVPGTPHSNHAVAAIRVRGRTITRRFRIRGRTITRQVRTERKLFVFDPWGHASQPITGAVATSLARMLNVSTQNVFVYNGRNLQERNAQGACVGFAADFLIKARGAVLNGTNFNTKVSNMFRANANDPGPMFTRLTRREQPGPNSVVHRNT